MKDQCSLCEHDLPRPQCHYVNCPHRKKGMPVKVKSKDPRTLWITTVRPDLYAHQAFADMFDGCLPLGPQSIIRPNDVVFFDGGTDIDAQIYGESRHIMNQTPDTFRDEAERTAFRRAQGAGAKCLGICRGAQLLVALSGGKLVQHVSGHGSGHMIITDSGEAVYSESSHHQVMWPYEIPHVLLSWAPQYGLDKIVISDEYGKEFMNEELPEIVYCKDTKSLCIQGHPEYLGVEAPFSRVCRDYVREFLLAD